MRPSQIIKQSIDKCDPDAKIFLPSKRTQNNNNNNKKIIGKDYISLRRISTSFDINLQSKYIISDFEQAISLSPVQSVFFPFRSKSMETSAKM